VVKDNRGANTAWCGRRDDGMIFNPNDLEVAPPHTRGVGRFAKFEKGGSLVLTE
jgi:hypothetical protein